jgi:hypothetical protein
MRRVGDGSQEHFYSDHTHRYGTRGAQADRVAHALLVVGVLPVPRNALLHGTGHWVDHHRFRVWWTGEVGEQMRTYEEALAWVAQEAPDDAATVGDQVRRDYMSMKQVHSARFKRPIKWAKS